MHVKKINPQIKLVEFVIVMNILLLLHYIDSRVRMHCVKNVQYVKIELCSEISRLPFSEIITYPT